MNKYNARPVDADGFRFDSLAEYRRYSELNLLQEAGLIRNLKVHPRFPIVINGVKICAYEADFQYDDVESGLNVVEDVKGVRTAVFVLKKKLMKAVHNIEVIEVKA